MPQPALAQSTAHALAPDRRQAARRQVALKANILCDRAFYIPCTVRDISPMGAGLELDVEAILPRAFRLQIPGDLVEVDCVLKHCRGRYAGVTFVSGRAELMARYG